MQLLIVWIVEKQVFSRLNAVLGSHFLLKSVEGYLTTPAPNVTAKPLISFQINTLETQICHLRPNE